MIDEQTLIQEYVINGLPMTTIMKKYRIRHKPLNQLFKQYGVEIRGTKKVDLQELNQYYIVENHTQKEVFEKFGLTHAELRRILKRNGLKKTTIESKPRMKMIDQQELIQYYIIENHTANDTASKFGITYDMLMNQLKKYGIRKSTRQRMNNTYKTNISKYGSKTKFGSKSFKQWRKDNIETIMERMKQTFQSKYGVDSFVESSEAKNVWKMGTSKAEMRIFEKLKQTFPDTINHYKSNVYPFNCDFYIPSIDTYIEYQGFYTHGNEPFDQNNCNHVNEMNELLNKGDEYSLSKLHIWCEQDPLKRRVAKENGLKWFEFFDEKQFDEWLEKING